MAEDGVARVGVMLESLSSRFELVIEAISGIGGRIDTLRGEMVEQFAEVGKQIRFLSQQIGDNRDSLAALRAELSAEMVRLGEALGSTRVEFRQQLAEARSSTRQAIDDGAHRTLDQVRTQLATTATGEFRAQIAAAAGEARESLRDEAVELRDGMRTEIAKLGDGLRGEIAHRTEAATRQLSAELKQAQKSLASLSKKFDRFDDRVSVEVKDHEQRLRKVERRARG